MTACPWGAIDPMQAKWKFLPLASVLSNRELALSLLAFPQPSLSLSLPYSSVNGLKRMINFNVTCTTNSSEVTPDICVLKLPSH